MNSHPNINIIQNFFTAFANNDMHGIRAVMSDNIRWIIPGHHPLSGTKTGIAEVMAYFELLAKVGFKAEPKFLEANDQYVVDVHRVYSTIGEAILDGTSILVWKIENNRVVEVQNFPGDQHAWDDFFWKTYELKPISERLNDALA